MRLFILMDLTLKALPATGVNL